MNVRLFYLFFVLLCWVMPGLVAAATSASRSIHIEWGYTPPSQPQVSGYRLYQEGVRACQTTSATATAMDCTVTQVKEVTNFTLTATFADNTESPHSAPFAFSLADKSSQTQAGTTTSTPPTAVLSSSTAAGTSPFKVSFDGLKSAAGSGKTLASYQWQFGDNSSASGSSATHTYNQTGIFTATLTVTDSKGLQNSASTPIIVTAPTTASVQATKTTTSTATASTASVATTATAAVGTAANSPTSSRPTTQAQAPSSLRLEAGEIAVTSDWRKVIFANTYQQPIVVTGPVSMLDQAPVTVRLRNITATGFEVRLVPWPYQSAPHKAESVSYLVVEKGRHTLADGSSIEAGSFVGSTGLNSISWHGSFTRTPVVLTAITSNNDAEAISGRVLPRGTMGFVYTFREQELNRFSSHARETVHYVAWETGKGDIGAFQYETAVSAQTITGAWKSVTLQSSFKQSPLLFVDMQSFAELDPATLRVQRTSSKGFQTMIQEEQSLNQETTHRAEKIGYLAIDPVTLR